MLGILKHWPRKENTKMKKLRYLGVLLAVLSIAGMVNNEAGAADWYVCDVVAVGPSLGTVTLYLKYISGPTAWTGSKAFNTGTADAARTNRILATALTAESLDRPVRISVDTTAPTVATSCYLWY